MKCNIGGAERCEAPAWQDSDFSGMSTEQVCIATCNANGLNSKRAEVLAKLDEHNIDVLVIQEDRVPIDSVPAMRQAFREKGYHLLRALPDFDQAGHAKGGLSIASRWPISQEALPVELDQPARVLCSMLHRPCQPPLRLVGVYFDAADHSRRVTLMNQIMSHLNHLGGDCMLIGDFNCQMEETPVATYLAAGRLYAIETYDELATPTRPAGKRNIDYALTSSQVVLRNRRQVSGVSDHAIVLYDLSVSELEPTLRWPLAVPLEATERRSDADWHDVFQARAKEFSDTVATHDSHRAWHILSGEAERMMRLNHDRGGRSRAEVVRPVQLPTISKAAKSNEPVGVRQLRKLRRQATEIQKVGIPDPQLRYRAGANLARLARRHETLEKMNLWDEASLVIIDNVIRAVLQRDAIQRIQKWQQRMENGERHLLRWVLADPADEVLPPGSKASVHPQLRAVEERTKLSKLWSAMPAAATALDDFCELFPPGGYPCGVEMKVQGSELFRLAREAAGSGAGPDAWNGDMFACLPLGFFDRLADIWNMILAGALSRLPGSKYVWPLFRRVTVVETRDRFRSQPWLGALACQQ